MSGLTSASGFLSLLDEPDNRLKLHSLKSLNQVVGQFWAEIAASIPKIESLYEDDTFPDRELAALVTSKVFFHLGEMEDALQYALGAGSLFDVSERNEFVDNIIQKCIDEYIRLRTEAYTKQESDNDKIDPRLKNIVERMFQRCYTDKEYRQALGVAIESRRLDKLEETVSLTQEKERVALLQYTFDACHSITLPREFRRSILNLLVKWYHTLEEPPLLDICRCLMILDDVDAVTQILLSLLRGDETKALTSYQIAFDLIENERFRFLKDVLAKLPDPSKPAEEGEEQPKDDAIDPDRLKRLRKIVSGEKSTQLILEFLCRNNHADLMIMNGIKSALDHAPNSISHNAAVCANALMHAGTTVDVFLRDNLEWLARASNWAKFSATACLGVIQKGHLSQALNLLAPYLPQDAQSAGSSPYSEGGALYALGLIYAAMCDPDMRTYLERALSQRAHLEPVQHGACLGLGLAMLASGNEEVYNELKAVMYNDNAVAGEAAGLGMGLVMLGTGSETALDEMLTYAHETQHGKIIRGLAVGIAFVMYGLEEAALPMIEQLTRDSDPILRFGGMYTIAMAFCGTGNNDAIRRLLHVAVSDVSNDVRRAAVMGLGFVLLSNPEQCPRVVELLAESFNPHVRYGAALAVGICCAGTGLSEAIALLQPLAKDSVDFVRQGAMISLAMITMQMNETECPKVADIRKIFSTSYENRHDEIMAKFGAILAAGIIDAGGRNVTISLQSRAGYNRVVAVVGMALFTQYWYWYPMIHCLSLSFSPTTLIALNKDLNMPEFGLRSEAAPSMFAYPPPVPPPSHKKAEKVSHAVLSTTAKAKAREKQKQLAKDKAEGKMEVEPASPSAATTSTSTPTPAASETPATQATMEVEPAGGEKKEGEEGEKNEEKKEKEPGFELLKNPCRITRTQELFVKFTEDTRYTPIVPHKTSGFILLVDSAPGTEEKLILVETPENAAEIPSVEQEGPEPAPPAPFAFTE